MERIINNKRYSTQTAKKVAESGGIAMFRKTTGEFFLHDEAKSEITPITRQVAEQWARSHGVTDIEPAKSKSQTLLLLNAETINSIKRYSVEDGCSASQFVNELVRKESDRRKKKKPQKKC